MKICTEKSGRSFSTTLEGKLESSSMNSSWTNFAQIVFYKYMKNMVTWFISSLKKLDEGTIVQPKAWGFFTHSDSLQCIT